MAACTTQDITVGPNNRFVCLYGSYANLEARSLRYTVAPHPTVATR